MPEARRQSSDVRGRRSETRGGVGARRSEVRGFATESACLWQAATGEKGHFLVSIGVNQRPSAVRSVSVISADSARGRNRKEGSVSR